MALFKPDKPAVPPPVIKANSDLIDPGGAKAFQSVIGGSGTTALPLTRKANTSKTTLIGGA